MFQISRKEVPPWPGGHADEERVLERVGFLEEIRSVFNRTSAHWTRLLSIEGGWGLGKTALFDQACAIADRSSCLVLRARGGELEKHAPFSVLERIVELAHERVVSVALEGELAQEFSARLVSPSSDDVYALGTTFYSLLRQLRRRGPVLVAIDDADLIDRETATTLQFAFHRFDDEQIWLLLTSRPRLSGVTLRPVDWLLVEPDARHFPLEPLGIESVVSLISDALGKAPDEPFADACLAATAGNPMFLRTLLETCAERQIQPTALWSAGIASLQVPRITQQVLCKLALLPVASTDLLEACSVIGDSVHLRAAQQLAKIDLLAARRAATAAEQLELIHEGRPLCFNAPIVRWAVYLSLIHI